MTSGPRKAGLGVQGPCGTTSKSPLHIPRTFTAPQAHKGPSARRAGLGHPLCLKPRPPGLLSQLQASVYRLQNADARSPIVAGGVGETAGVAVLRVTVGGCFLMLLGLLSPRHRRPCLPPLQEPGRQLSSRLQREGPSWRVTWHGSSSH